MSDHNYELYVEKKQAREEGHAEGLAEGRAEGLAEGRAEGLAEGRKEGRAEGCAEGREKERADNLAILQDMNLSSEQIAEFKARLEARRK